MGARNSRATFQASLWKTLIRSRKGRCSQPAPPSPRPGSHASTHGVTGSHLPSRPQGGEGAWPQPQGDRRVGTGYRVTRKQDREPDGAQARQAVTAQPTARKAALSGAVPAKCLHTLPPNVLTLRARDTVLSVQTSTLSLRAAGTCSTLHSWTLAAVRSGSWPRTLTEGGAVGAGPSTLRDRDSRPSQSHRGEGSGEPGTAPRAPPPRPSLSPREGHSGLSSDSCPAREAPLTFALERLSS